MILEKGKKNKDLKKASFDTLSKKFQESHDIIWEGGKRDPAASFDEFSKLLMIKTHDERFTPSGKKYKFQIYKNESPSESANRIKGIYELVRNKNPKVFNVDIRLPDLIIFKIVNIFQDVSLRKTDLDVKGRAFEKFLGKVFRDRYGQYFTPRNVINFMVKFLDPDEDDILIDPACGSGGFLLFSLMHVLEKVNDRYKEDKDSINRIGWEFAHKQIYGIEINDRIARIAMMDMIIHEDGHSNIECNDALREYENFDKRKEITSDKYSKVYTNPPFGSKVENPNVLEKYTLGRNRDKQKSEILFIERCLDLLEEGGKLGIVVPDSILRNSTLQYVREYILNKAELLGVISLAQHAFVPSGAMVKSSLLFLKKTSSPRKKYEIFMAKADHIGYDSRGKNDNDDLPQILDDWLNYNKGENELKIAFIKQLSDVRNNFSPNQFVFYSNNHGWEYRPLSELCESIFIGKTPSRKQYTTEGHKILKVRDLTNNCIIWENSKRGFVSKDFFEKRKKYQVKQNDILFITSAHHPKYIGRKVDIVNLIPNRFKDGILCSAEIMIVRVNSNNINPYYVLSYLRSKEGYNSIQSCIRGQTAHIYPKDIKSIKIPIPSKEEYKKIEEELEKMKKSLNEKTIANEDYLNQHKIIISYFE